MTTFKTGQRVRLKPVDDFPEEFGVIVEAVDETSYLVEVDKKYRTNKADDGLRDGVPAESIEVVKKKGRSNANL